jgi:hypothetical protein
MATSKRSHLLLITHHCSGFSVVIETRQNLFSRRIYPQVQLDLTWSTLEGESSPRKQERHHDGPQHFDQHHSRSKRYVRIDARVPAAVANDMMQLAFTSGQVMDFWMVQSEVGGSMLLDATVSAPLAAVMLTRAKQHGLRAS